MGHHILIFGVMKWDAHTSWLAISSVCRINHGQMKFFSCSLHSRHRSDDTFFDVFSSNSASNTRLVSHFDCFSPEHPTYACVKITSGLTAIILKGAPVPICVPPVPFQCLVSEYSFHRPGLTRTPGVRHAVTNVASCHCWLLNIFLLLLYYYYIEPIV